ncbi:MAG: hypothetical protein ABIM89_16075 [Mycobacteriales bacterium]
MSTAMWLPGGVSAHVHVPTRPPGAGLVIVPPFGWEDVSSYRVRREWADSLAAAGHPVVRLDLPGTGDSAGSTDRPRLLADWTASVLDATDLLREAGSTRVALLGLGLGGVVACLAAQDGRVDDLALWSVPSRGRTMVRQLRLAADRPEAQAAAAGGGALWLFGYSLPGSALAELQELDLAALQIGGAGHRVLLLGRDGIEPESRLVEAVKASGAELRMGPGHGYSALVEHPQTSTASREVWSELSDWLAVAPLSAASKAAGMALRPDAAVIRDGVTETHVQLDTTQGTICAVVTRPAKSSGLGLVLLGAGATRRAGPNRLYVQASRAAAELGVTSVRFDLPGLGDTPGRAAWSADSAAFYDARRVGQVRAVLAALETVDFPSRIVLAGLCSGAYWSFVLGQEDPRVVGIAMFNPRALTWDAAAAFRLAQPRVGAVLLRGTWRRLLTDAGSRHRARRFVRSLIHRALPFLTERPKNGAADEVKAALDTLHAADIALLLAFESSDREVLLQLRAEGILDAPDRWPRLDLHVLTGAPGVNSSFAPPDLQSAFVSLVLRALATAVSGPVSRSHRGVAG